MRIQLVSDLHMEFAPINLSNAGADLLILSGDIVVAERFKRSAPSPYVAIADAWRSWFERVCAQFENVIYIPGNHEHYHGRFHETVNTLRAALVHIPNLHILDNQFLDLGGIRFFGTTLWTDFDHNGLHMAVAREGMNDYKCIQGLGYRKLTPMDTALYHEKAIHSIEQSVRDCDRMVVCGHHLPSYRSVDSKYVRYSHLNPAYASHLDTFIRDNPKITLWTHGHTHSSSDYMIGDTRIVANPRGYCRSIDSEPENVNFNPNLVIEV